MVEIEQLEKKLQKERDDGIRVRVVSIDPDAGRIRIGILSNLARPEKIIPLTHGQLHFLIHKFKNIEKHFFAEESEARQAKVDMGPRKAEELRAQVGRPRPRH